MSLPPLFLGNVVRWLVIVGCLLVLFPVVQEWTVNFPSSQGSIVLLGNSTKTKKVSAYHDKWTKRMKELGMTQSLVQHQHYFERKDRIMESKAHFSLLYNFTTPFAAYRLTDKFCFRHIFKNGGTTVESQTRSKHITHEEAMKCDFWVVTVRDPIDHFFSGWRECGNRFPDQLSFSPGNLVQTKVDAYDARVRFWLKHTKRFATEGKEVCREKGYPLSVQACACAAHSFAQANFLLDTESGDTNKTAVDNVEVVGDLHELPHLLRLVGFNFDDNLPSERNSTLYEHYDDFAKRLDLVSNETMLSICEFLKLDYFLFNFKMPEACASLG